MNIIQTENMPKAGGHYSHCIEHNGLLYISGQLPFDPVTRKLGETIEEQSLQALKNAEQIIIEAGSTKTDVLQVRIYVSDINMWEKVNEVYSKFFGEHKPVRCLVPSGLLHYGCLIEIEMIAVKNTNG